MAELLANPRETQKRRRKKKKAREEHIQKQQENDNKNLRLKKKSGEEVTLADMKTTKVDFDVMKMGGSSITDAKTRSERQTCF